MYLCSQYKMIDMMANLEKYMDLQADFYHYMVEFGG